MRNHCAGGETTKLEEKPLGKGENMDKKNIEKNLFSNAFFCSPNS